MNEQHDGEHEGDAAPLNEGARDDAAPRIDGPGDDPPSSDSPTEDAPGATPGRPRELRITVARSGGFGGLSPTWTVTASEESDVDSWLSLVESCPWDAAEPDDGEPDRFVYTIRVLQPEAAEPRDARVPEREVGPWRDLIDRVKEASKN
jgi:hypothetical protein